jgi:hypothetical protein
MPTAGNLNGLKVFSTRLRAALAQPVACSRRLEEMARWSEDTGCKCNGVTAHDRNAVLLVAAPDSTGQHG